MEMNFTSHPMRMAVIFMLISTAGASAMSIGVRLASESLSATSIVTLRNFLTLLLIVPFVTRDNFSAIRTKRLGDHIKRSAIGAVGMLTWTYCLTVMPLVHATALSFTAPLLTTLFAVLVHKEKAHRRHFIALAVGFMGTLIILRPSVTGFEWVSLLVLFSTSAWALTSLYIKRLSATEPALGMVFYMNLFMFLIALPLSFLEPWHWPDAQGWLALLAICIFSILMHFTMVKAYSLAPVVTLMPLDFMRLVYVSIFAYIFFGETSDWLTWAGAAIIIGSATFIPPRGLKQEITVD